MLTERVPTLFCEAPACRGQATHVYGPECEAESGKLMYLCAYHAASIASWKVKHSADPVDCPTHGTIGKVRDSVVLAEIPKSGGTFYV